MKTKKRPTRSPADNLGVALSPEAGARARAATANYGMTLSRYIESLVLGEQRIPLPASHARIGGCIMDALWALEQPEPNVAEAVRLLRTMQRLQVEFSLAYLPAFDKAHAADAPWDSPDRPERRVPR
jgi:hypothetical protein